MADHLSRFLVYHLEPREVPILEKLSHGIQHMPTVGANEHTDDKVLHVWRFLTTSNWPAELSSYDARQVSLFTEKFKLEGIVLFRIVNRRRMWIMMGRDWVSLFKQYHTTLGHCGAQKLLQCLIPHY